MLDIENSIITLDVMGCQKEIAKQIIEQKADYILALKGNHSGMQSELEVWWHKAQREGFVSENHAEYTATDSGYGRIETRICQYLLIDKKYRWVGLNSIIKITSEVCEKSTGKETTEVRWYISSLSLNAEQSLYSVRNHWQVESMHWMLDMTFREDESRIRKGRGSTRF